MSLAVTSEFACREAWFIDSRTPLPITRAFCCECAAAITEFSAGEAAFLDIGGFPDVPLMEDVEFYRRLHRCGRVRYSGRRILVSPRRYETLGRTRLTLAYGVIATLYVFGVPLSILARIYKRMCCDALKLAGVRCARSRRLIRFLLTRVLKNTMNGGEL